MLKRLELFNFKSHRSTQINFDDSRLHALVGQNSSGKTSVLQAIHYISQLADSDFSSVFNCRSPEFISTIGQNDFSIGSFWRTQNNQKILEASFEFRRYNAETWQPRVLWKIDQAQQDQIDIQGWNASFINAPNSIREALRHTVYLKLVSANLAKAAYSEEITPRVRFDGSELAPTLDYLRNETPKQFQSLQEMLKQIVPGVRKIGVRRAKVRVTKSLVSLETSEVVGQEVVLDMNTGDRIPAHAVSEGTMLALGLLTVLMSPEQPNLVLLDDVEQGLHPKAQRELMTVFKQILQANPNLQIIFSTHSPYIVDELMPSQVHVLSNTNSGFTRCKRLDEHPDIEWAKQTLTTGEFWDAEGEDWVTAGEMNA